MICFLLLGRESGNTSKGTVSAIQVLQKMKVYCTAVERLRLGECTRGDDTSSFKTLPVLTRPCVWKHRRSLDPHTNCIPNMVWPGRALQLLQAISFSLRLSTEEVTVKYLVGNDKARITELELKQLLKPAWFSQAEHTYVIKCVCNCLAACRWEYKTEGKVVCKRLSRAKDWEIVFTRHKGKTFLLTDQELLRKGQKYSEARLLF